ncbi:methyl-accepting chemotaxis protein [Qipengyuania sp. XHP0207]|uniref:methyl-accepting chemotaxis protein n=1 Tax=Qipengyuania sp. XHP0207 TaxID=3038078 RepID=UPI00241DE9F2|nr:methyl-accepting chemotaxis protein [Qipengyuania sp. XHP0207]MDG5749232.1 methyl-accepting chemotaxis protein [Qipengyuania sp. XHP0207]
MTALRDLTDQFVKDEAAEQQVFENAPAMAVSGSAPVRSRSSLERWFSNLDSDDKLRVTAGFPILMIALVALVALFGLSRIDPTSGAENIASSRTIVMTCVGLSAAFFGLIIALSSRILSSDVVDTVRILNDDMRRIASGQTDFAISIQGRVDEYGEMSESLEILRLKMADLEQLMDERVKSADDRHVMLERLATELENGVGEVAGSVAAAATQLHSTATSMAASAEQASSATHHALEAMGRASEGAIAAAASSDEFAMSIGEISRQAAHSADLARKANDAASGADETIMSLAEAADQVGAIVELIQSIAKRTNLLALNASIEAARGGESGRGFAVVASEVKELAAQTSRATDDVAAQIRAMQESTGASVSALRAIAEHIREMEGTASSIASAVDQQSVAGRDMARSIDIAAQGTEEVTASMQQVRESAVATGSASSQLLGSSSDLEQQASELRRQVATFLSRVKSAR